MKGLSSKQQIKFKNGSVIQFPIKQGATTMAAKTKKEPLSVIECKEGIIPVWVTHTHMLDPKGLLPHPDNNNLHTEEQQDILKAALRASGWRENVVVSEKTGRIVSGHLRVLTAIAMGMEKIPVDMQWFKNRLEEVRHLTADNELARLAKFDGQKFISTRHELLQEFQKEEFQLTLMSPNEWGMDQFPKPIDEDGSPDKPAVLMLLKEGDVYQLGSHTLTIGTTNEHQEPYLQKFLKGWKKIQGVQPVLEKTGQSYEEVIDERREEVRNG